MKAEQSSQITDKSHETQRWDFPGNVSFDMLLFCNSIFDVDGLTIHICTEQCHNPFACTWDRVAYVFVEIGRSLYGSKVDGGGCISSNRSPSSCAVSSACGFVVVAIVSC